MNAAFSAQAFQPAFAWDRPAQFATSHLPGTVGRSRPGTSRAGYSRQRAAVGGEYGPDGILRAGGKFIPGAEGPPDAGPEAQQPQVENSGALQPQQAGDEDYGQTAGYMPDEGGGAMPAQSGQQPAAQAAAPLPKPLRDHVIDYPSLGDEPQHQVKAGMAWLRQPIGPLPHQDDEHAWASLGLTPETLPGMLLHSVGNRGHKFAQWFGKGVAQVLGDDAAFVSQVPIQKAFLFATLHPDIQEHFRRYSKDPLGKSINGSETEAMRTLTRAVNTLKDNPGFGQDYGRAAALGIAEAMQPPPNPDLQQFAIQHPSQTWNAVRDWSVPAHPEKDKKNAVRGMNKEGYPYDHKLLAARDRPLEGGSGTVDLVSAQSQAGPKKLIRKGGHAKGKFLQEEQQNENFLRALGVAIPRSSYPHTDVSDPASPQRKVADFVPGLKPVLEPMQEADNFKQFFRYLLGKKPKGPRAAEGVRGQIRGHAVAHALVGNLDVFPNNLGNTMVDPEGKAWWIDEGPEGMDPKRGRWGDYRDASGTKLLHMLMPSPGDNEVREQMERLHGQLPAALEHIQDPQRRAAILRRYEELRAFYAKHLSAIPGEPSQPQQPPLAPSDPEWWQQQFTCA